MTIGKISISKDNNKNLHLNQMNDKIKFLKFFIERRFVELFLWFLSLTSLILIFKTSNEPILDVLSGSFVDRLLQRFSFANTLVYDLSLGFIVSVIFYLIVVYFPDKRKRKDIEPLISSKCESLIYSSYGLVFTIIDKSNLGYNYKNLTNEEFSEICKIVNPKEHQFKFAQNITEIFEGHLGYKIYHDWLRVNREIDELLRLLPYIESGLLKRVYGINNCFLRYLVNDLAYIDKLKNDNLDSWSHVIFDFYLKTKELRDYYKFYFRKDFGNDPWK